MIKEWGFVNKPLGSLSPEAFRWGVLVGYPFRLFNPAYSDDFTYTRRYLADPVSLKTPLMITISLPASTEDSDTLDYMRNYLGKV